MKKTVAIETSCDDTSLSVVTFDGEFFSVEKILSFSQVDLHQPYGGVVPEIAYRSHADKIVRMLEELWGTDLAEEIDFISVTSHPWLPGALVVGVTVAHTLGTMRNKEVIEVNHIMGHVFSVLAERSLQDIQFPYLCLTVSGGHNDIYLVEQWEMSNELWEKKPSLSDEKNQNEKEKTGRHKRMHLAVGESLGVWPYTVTKLGQTIDDASWEVFDKVARMLDGPYPGGARIWKTANEAKEQRSNLFQITYKDPETFMMSFSGLKSKVQQYIEKYRTEFGVLGETEKAEIARSFQESVVQTLVTTLERAIDVHQPATIGIVGWVSANQRLKEVAHLQFQTDTWQQRSLLFPTKIVYCTDNAAMIGVVGHIMTMNQ